MTRHVRAAIQQYLERGFRPIPMYGVDACGGCLCGGILPGGRECNAGKHARDDREPWKDGREYGPEDFADEDNVAIALGPWRPDRWLVCLDIDGHDSATPFFPGLDLPRTLSQKSPKGLHLFFAVRPYAPLGNWVDAFATKYLDGYALDVRYARGKINVAPSRSAVGSYRWLDWREPAELPESAIDTILDERRRRGLPVAETWERGGKAP